MPQLKKEEPRRRARGESPSYDDLDRCSSAGKINALRFADSYARLSCVIDLYYDLNRRVWWQLLGSHWSSCDNIRFYSLLLRSLLKADRNYRHWFMRQEDFEVYQNLPEVITVYRGAYLDPQIDRGLSWSLEWDVAAIFPFLQR